MSKKLFFDGLMLSAAWRDWLSAGVNPLEHVRYFEYAASDGSPLFTCALQQRGWSDGGDWVAASRQRYSTKDEALEALNDLQRVAKQ